MKPIVMIGISILIYLFAWQALLALNVSVEKSWILALIPQCLFVFCFRNAHKEPEDWP